jgi:chorismate mutase/prephenate dehydrogenase
MSLENLRDALSAVDRQIIDLISERQRIVGEIGRSKLSKGTATRDYAREKDVVDRGREQAESRRKHPDDLDPLIAREPGAGSRHRRRQG